MFKIFDVFLIGVSSLAQILVWLVFGFRQLLSSQPNEQLRKAAKDFTDQQIKDFMALIGGAITVGRMSEDEAMFYAIEVMEKGEGFSPILTALRNIMNFKLSPPMGDGFEVRLDPRESFDDFLQKIIAHMKDGQRIYDADKEAFVAEGRRTYTQFMSVLPISFQHYFEVADPFEYAGIPIVEVPLPPEPEGNGLIERMIRAAKNSLDHAPIPQGVIAYLKDATVRGLNISDLDTVLHNIEPGVHSPIWMWLNLNRARYAEVLQAVEGAPAPVVVPPIPEYVLAAMQQVNNWGGTDMHDLDAVRYAMRPDIDQPAFEWLAANPGRYEEALNAIGIKTQPEQPPAPVPEEIPQIVIEGLDVVRESAVTNMMDKQRVLLHIPFQAAEDWLNANPDRYMDALNAMGEYAAKKNDEIPF